MCGRYTYVDADGVLRFILGFTQKSKMRPVSKEPWIKPNYNAAIGNGHPIVMNNGEAAIAQWSLVPSWSPTKQLSYSTFNAKAETLTSTKVFGPLVKYRRCAVPADGFIEFRHEGRKKIPYHLRLKSREVFCFAGLWDTWMDELLSYTIITTSPNELVKPLHHRMAVVLRATDCPEWLETGNLSLLKPFPADEMEAVEINPIVNSVSNNEPKCLQPPPPEPEPQQQSLF